MIKQVFFVFLFFISLAACTTETKETNYEIQAVALPDSDCDGVPDANDLCPGIDDKVDQNNDGKPDCRFPPANYNQVIARWKCGTPSLKKAFVCFKTNSGGTITICTPYSAINTHIANGNRLGVCGEKKCGN